VELYTGLFETALEPGELLVEVAIPPPPPRSGWAFEEFARRHGDYALAGVATALTLDGDGRCAEARVVYLGVGEGPTEAPSAVAALLGQTPTGEAIRGAAADAAERDVDPPGDVHATAAYRRHLVEILTRRALVRAVERAQSSNTASLDR
jgi:carbon-monoxide dehydrogenase medium subunit